MLVHLLCMNQPLVANIQDNEWLKPSTVCIGSLLAIVPRKHDMLPGYIRLRHRRHTTAQHCGSCGSEDSKLLQLLDSMYQCLTNTTQHVQTLIQDVEAAAFEAFAFPGHSQQVSVGQFDFFKAYTP